MGNRPTTAAAEVKSLMEEGHAAAEISKRLGISPSATRSFMKRIDSEYRPTIKRPMMPYGLTKDSQLMRARLGSLLYDLAITVRDIRKVCNLVGLNKGEYSRAVRNPYNHDWSLAQIQRLHTSLGIDVNFTKLVEPANYNTI